MKKAPRRIRIATALTVLVILALVFAGRLPLLPQVPPRFCAAALRRDGGGCQAVLLPDMAHGRLLRGASPLGILQDFIGWVSRRKNKNATKNLKMLRYTILAVRWPDCGRLDNPGLFDRSPCSAAFTPVL